MGVERQKEPAVTGLLARTLEGEGRRGEGRRVGTADLDHTYATAAATLRYFMIQVKADYSLLSWQNIPGHQAVKKEIILYFN